MLKKGNEKYPIEDALENSINKISASVVKLINKGSRWAFPKFREYKKMGFFLVLDHIVFYYLILRILVGIFQYLTGNY